MHSAWKTLRFLETEPTSRKFLAACYEKMGLEHSDRLAFQQSTRFLYLWKQARHFYATAEAAELSVQPLLLFYGCTHLLKGMLLTRDAAYPQNSRMLQHGVTTRKLKRSTYSLLEDEIRPQKEGFFAHLAHLFDLSPLQDRYIVQDLFLSIPAMSHSTAMLTDTLPLWICLQGRNFDPSRSDSGKLTAHCDPWLSVSFPDKPDGPLAYSAETFAHYVDRNAPPSWTMAQIRWRTATGKELLLPQPALSCLDQHPLFRFYGDELFFWNGPSESLPLPEWASHYLLLYLLSMLCRYETEWWGELTLSHGFAERFLVERYLEQHIESFPTVIMKQMAQINPDGWPS
ncbi:YaaC family protein [Brevibacillus sp. GCM10020057]|uniref:YaaC family protein n=1 Tax=Brevibacillus sp. GCM10020057 TaxID=3317327 RepID=UPI003631145D